MLSDRLRRITRDGRWTPEVDGLRSVAICSIFLFHLLGEVTKESRLPIHVEANYLQYSLAGLLKADIFVLEPEKMASSRIWDRGSRESLGPSPRGLCYSIYLLHYLFIVLLFRVTRHAIPADAIVFVNYSIQLLLMLVPVTAVCAVFFLLIERPCMDPEWPSKLWYTFTARPQNKVPVFDAGSLPE